MDTNTPETARLYDPTDQENQAIIQALKSLPIGQTQVILHAFQGPLFRLVGQAEHLHAELATTRTALTRAEEEVNGLREGIQSALQSLYDPDMHEPINDFKRGINHERKLNNDRVLELAALAGVEITPAAPACNQSCTTCKKGGVKS